MVDISIQYPQVSQVKERIATSALHGRIKVKWVFCLGREIIPDTNNNTNARLLPEFRRPKRAAKVYV